VEALNLDWQHWFNRWEAMQNCYVPHRIYRFDLMFRLADLPREDEVKILDLGCGPGVPSFRALRCYPNASVVAVDFDPILLAMGQGIAREATDCIQFIQADIRQAEWWAGYEEQFDLILLATALHWLSAGSLTQLYACIYRALKPGGWFMNSDHMASNDPNTQVHYRKALHVDQQSAFCAWRADDWNGFWRSLSRELGQTDLLAQRSEAELWEGTDDGQPRQFHVTALRECGFEQVAFHWQDLGEAVVSARKRDA
jgi:SAM-dependent methyltransferase